MNFKIVCIITLFLLAFTLTLQADEEFNEKIYISTSYNNLLSNPEHTGFLDRIISEVFAGIRIKAEFVRPYTGSSLVDADTGIADAVINRIEGFENRYPNLVQADEPNIVLKFVAFSKNEYIIDDGWDSLRELNIGIVAGWKFLESGVEGFEHITVVPSVTELFRMLEKNRIDVAVFSEIIGNEYLNRTGIGKSIKQLEPALGESPMYLYFSAKSSGLNDQYSDSLRSIKADGTYDEIKNEMLKK